MRRDIGHNPHKKSEQYSWGWVQKFNFSYSPDEEIKRFAPCHIATPFEELTGIAGPDHETDGCL
jgi:hypothetical protein